MKPQDLTHIAAGIQTIHKRSAPCGRLSITRNIPIGRELVGPRAVPRRDRTLRLAGLRPLWRHQPWPEDRRYRQAQHS